MPDGLYGQNINLTEKINIVIKTEFLGLNKMNSLRFVAIIPARFASTRFPGKPLANIGGKPMIQRVFEQVSKAVDDVYVATDDQRIYNAVVAFNGKAIMTSDRHRSGTDRCYEAFTKLNEWYDVVINIQGDEPFIQPEQIEILKSCFIDDETRIATLSKKVTKKMDWIFCKIRIIRN